MTRALRGAMEASMADYAVVVTVEAVGGNLSPAAWHGWMYRALGRGADVYHAAHTPPFSLRPVLGWEKVRFVILDGPLAGKLGLGSGVPGPNGVPVRRVAARVVDYSALMAGAERRGKLVTFRFVTPVSFAGGPRLLLLPTPRLVFGSLKRTWDRFVERDLAGWDIGACEEGVEVADVRLETVMVDTGHGKERGVVGEVTYRILRPELVGSLWTLAWFGELAGVGKHRAQGMGVVEVRRRSGPVGTEWTRTSVIASGEVVVSGPGGARNWLGRRS